MFNVGDVIQLAPGYEDKGERGAKYPVVGINPVDETISIGEYGFFPMHWFELVSPRETTHLPEFLW